MDWYYLPPAKSLNTLNACVLIEECCARIYRHYASLFSEQPDLAGLWRELAKDEDDHAEKFRMAVATHGTKPRCVADDNYLIEAIVENLNTVIEELSMNPPSLRDAMITTAVLEHSIEKYHVATGALLVDDELKGLLLEMVHNDQCHRKVFESIPV